MYLPYRRSRCLIFRQPCRPVERRLLRRQDLRGLPSRVRPRLSTPKPIPHLTALLEVPVLDFYVLGSLTFEAISCCQLWNSILLPMNLSTVTSTVQDRH